MLLQQRGVVYTIAIRGKECEKPNRLDGFELRLHMQFYERKKRDKKTNRLERFELFLHMEIFEKNEKGLKRRISWEEFSISCQHMQYEQRNSKGSERQIGWVGSFYPAI